MAREISTKKPEAKEAQNKMERQQGDMKLAIQHIQKALKQLDTQKTNKQNT